MACCPAKGKSRATEHWLTIGGPPAPFALAGYKQLAEHQYGKPAVDRAAKPAT
jgi:hypothetical protein